jgi:dipeptidase E
MRLLLLSNSTNAGEPFLEYPGGQIQAFLGNKNLNAVFIPYAAVTFSFDEYERIVAERFHSLGYNLHSVHRFDSPLEAIRDAEVIVTGGGNTFQLLKLIQDNNLVDAIRAKVLNGTPYIGWSAGSNMACPTIRTTNDMPIVEPAGFIAFNFVPFQINPHYNDFVPKGFGGETRDQRIAEFLIANQTTTVVGLREGTMLRYEKDMLSLIGPHKAKIFNHNQPAFELDAADDFNFLMQ